MTKFREVYVIWVRTVEDGKEYDWAHSGFFSRENAEKGLLHLEKNHPELEFTLISIRINDENVGI